MSAWPRRRSRRASNSTAQCSAPSRKDTRIASATFFASLIDFGAEPHGAAFDLPAQGVRVCFVDTPNSQIELIEPLGESSPIVKFLEKNPLGGQHHVCFEVPDIQAAKAEFEAKGARVLGEPRIGAHGTLVFFVHPKDMGGVLTEIMETPKGAH